MVKYCVKSPSVAHSEADWLPQLRAIRLIFSVSLWPTSLIARTTLLSITSVIFLMMEASTLLRRWLRTFWTNFIVRSICARSSLVNLLNQILRRIALVLIHVNSRLLIGVGVWFGSVSLIESSPCWFCILRSFLFQSWARLLPPSVWLFFLLF